MKTTLALALLMLPGLCGAQDKMAEAIRKGIVEEETNHNLNAAIQSYQSVLAQYDGDRQAVATALFRIAECYRKQGKSTEATAAYSRVVKDFADQTKLAEQSRSHLPIAQQAAGSVDPAIVEARRKYRALLQEGLKYAKEEWDFISQQYLQKAISYLDTYEAQEQIARFKGRLAAFDAGLIPPLPAGPGTPAALAARTEYRQSLQVEVNFASLKLDATRAKQKLGAASQGDVFEAEIKLVDADLALAALDAGFAEPPPTH